MTPETHIAKIVAPNCAECDLHLAKNWNADEVLKVLQEAVGGYIEVVQIGDMIMIVDEEGRLKHKPKNPRASLGAGRTIVGTVVVMKRDVWESYND